MIIVTDARVESLAPRKEDVDSLTDEIRIETSAQQMTPKTTAGARTILTWTKTTTPTLRCTEDTVARALLRLLES